jgi:hypothetical protein
LRCGRPALGCGLSHERLRAWSEPAAWPRVELPAWACQSQPQHP